MRASLLSSGAVPGEVKWANFQRYSLAKSNWQSGADLNIFKKGDRKDALFTIDAVVFKSKLFAIHGYKRNKEDSKSPNWVGKVAIVHCFDPS